MESLTKEKLFKLLESVPDSAIFNLPYSPTNSTSNIEVDVENFGANNQHWIIHMTPKIPVRKI